jgi:ClpX C4-type zinc finger
VWLIGIHSLPPFVPGLAAAPEQSCSFCGKSKHNVQSLYEGGCSRVQRAPRSCVFIYDECVTFCARVNADLLPSGSSTNSA